MQLNVSRGAPATGKTTRLREIAQMDGQSESQIIIGSQCTGRALERLIRQRAQRGATVICIDYCSEEQIELMQRLLPRLPVELKIYAVVAC